eukprot:scaffold4170_cov330-Prasinococcus_capsulatus_cf.AAC.3
MLHGSLVDDYVLGGRICRQICQSSGRKGLSLRVAFVKQRNQRFDATAHHNGVLVLGVICSQVPQRGRSV